MNLVEQLIAIHRGLDAGGIEHAFGGAIALAYWTQDPRGTSDIDVNLFVGVDRCEHVLDALPEGVTRDEASIAAIRRDGQARLWWDGTPVDVFFDYAEIHAAAARHRRIVPFGGGEIPILAAVELAVFKAMFDRTKDWADIEAMIDARRLDVDAVRDHLVAMLGEGDDRLDRLGEAIRRADHA